MSQGPVPGDVAPPEPALPPVPIAPPEAGAPPVTVPPVALPPMAVPPVAPPVAAPPVLAAPVPPLAPGVGISLPSHLTAAAAKPKAHPSLLAWSLMGSCLLATGLVPTGQH